MTQAQDEKKDKKATAEKYFSAIGRRKEAVATAKIFIEGEGKGSGLASLTVNEKSHKDYFPIAELREIVAAPLLISKSKSNYKIFVRVKGGGTRGQAEASRLAISRALCKVNEDFKKPLRDLGFLTVDDRRVERKKAGLKKARRAPQWKKR